MTSEVFYATSCILLIKCLMNESRNDYLIMSYDFFNCCCRCASLGQGLDITN